MSNNYEVARKNRMRILEAFRNAIKKECNQLEKYGSEEESPSDFDELNSSFPDALYREDLISKPMLDGIVESLLRVVANTLALPDMSAHSALCEKTSKEILEDNGYDSGEIVLFENESYDSALIGVSDDNRAVYSYDKMVEWYCNKNGCSEEEAREWIDYNTLRALPYAGAQAPIVVTEFLND